MKSNLLLIILLLAITAQTFAQKTFKNSVGIKPTNYSNLDLGDSDDGFIGRHIGVEYERLISQNDKWSIVLPISFGDLKTIMVSDFYRNGFDIYATPGVKYYPKGFQKMKGYSVAANLLVGQKKYDFNSWDLYVDFKGMFYGLMLNNHYALKLAKRFQLRFEGGIGIRYLSGTEYRSFYDDLEMKRVYRTNKIGDWNPVLNLSIGFHYRF